MAIRITYNNNTIESTGRSSELEFLPDDRQELVKTVTNTGQPSVIVEDYGYVPEGEVISLSATFSEVAYNNLLTIWKNRTQVTVRLDDGTTINNARIVIKRIQYYDPLLNKYKTVQLEVWRL
jgi:hypothetical protein